MGTTVLERPIPWARTSEYEKAWREVILGVGPKDPDEMCIDMRKEGFCVSALVQDLMKRPAFTFNSDEERINLIVKTPADLRMLWRSTRERVTARAQEMGYGLCPPEAAVQLRRQYREQPIGEWLFIAMAPIVDSIKDRPWILNVGHDMGGLWLSASSAAPYVAEPDSEVPEEFLSPNSLLVFTVRASTS